MWLCGVWCVVMVGCWFSGELPIAVENQTTNVTGPTAEYFLFNNYLRFKMKNSLAKKENWSGVSFHFESEEFFFLWWNYFKKCILQSAVGGQHFHLR